MAPTIHHPGQPGSSASAAAASSSGVRPQGLSRGAPAAPRPGQDQRKSELVCRVKYSNTLPDIPFDPKFIAYPFEPNRFIQYTPTSLERNYKYELLTEPDLGVHVDLILPETYEKPDDVFDDMTGERLPPMLDPKDEKLLEDEISDKTDARRSKQHAKILSWMRRPDYISTEQTRYQPTTIEKIESKVGYAVRKKLGTDHDLYMDREKQIAAIEKTFEDSKLPIEEHYSKKGVYPVEIMPVLPDDKMWKYPCAQVIFDSDPAPGGDSAANQNELMAQAMIRGVMDESGEQFVAYFLPTQETMEKRQSDFVEGREYDDEGEYEYKMFREYNWNVKSKASKGYEENFFFVIRETGIFYNELETRVRLSKRRLKQGQAPSNSKLVVRHRPPTKQEHKMQRYREKYLEPPGVDDEMSDDDEEEEEEEEGIADTKGDEDEGNTKRSVSPSQSLSSRSRSRSQSRSRSNSVSSKSKSRSPTRSRSRSRSRSGTPKSRSRSRSASRTPSRSRSATPMSRSSSAGSASPARSARSGSDSE